MNQKQQISFLKIGTTAKGPRLWIQGLRLEDAGFNVGLNYSLTYDTNAQKISISLVDEGSKKVSRKKVGDRYYPLIDIVNQKLLEVFPNTTRVRVILCNGLLIIQYHPYDFMRLEREARLQETLRQGGALSTASVAHGAGIMDYYLHKGIEENNDLRCGLIWAIEPINDYLQASLNNNPIWSFDSVAIEGRIEDIDSRDLEAPHILVAGLPCTGASRSGRSKNKLAFAEKHETAGTAFVAWLKLIKQLSPAILVLENVPEYQSTVSMHLITEALVDWGYQLHETIVGPELGAFENRRRMCLIAVSEGIDFELNLKPTRDREDSLGEILEEVALDSDRWKPCQYLHDKEARDKASGKGFRMLLVDSQSKEVKTIGAGYAKWRSTEPLVQHPTDSKLKRLLTVREHCKVKGIDEFLVSGLSDTKAHQCLGQSVLGPAFQAIGRNIGEALSHYRC